MKKNLWKLFFGAMFAFAAVAFVGCVDDNEDTEAPYLEVSPETLAFSTDGQPVEGGASAFMISTNRYWVATVEGDKTWLTLSAYEGNGSATVQVSIPENINDEAKIKIQIWNQVGPLLSQTVTIRSGDVKPAELIYKETFGTGTAASVAAYTGWDKSGEGSSTVTYDGSGCDIRNNLPSTGQYSNYPGSGGSNLMFGTGNTYFTVQQITLPENETNYLLSFGASYYSAPNIEIYSQLTVHLSADGETWTDAIPYTFEDFKPAMNWNLASINFTLKTASPTLYIKFESVKPAEGNYRIDDVNLVTGNGGGSVIDLGGNPGAPQVTPAAAKLGSGKGTTVALTVTSTSAWAATTTGSGFTIDKLNGSGSGTITVTAAAENTSTSTVVLGTIVVTNAAGKKTVEVSQAGAVGDVYYYTNIGTKAVSDNPKVATYDDWQATGSGIANVTYGGTEKTTVRSTGLANTGAYDGASGPNVVFFGTLPSYLTINNIAVPASQTNMKLTFGASRSAKVGNDYVNTFDKTKFLVSLSANGTTWIPVTYTINNGDQAEPFWVFATADFTLTAGVSAIYVKFEATEASVFRLDDITLAPGSGGQQIDLGGGSLTPSVATANYTNLQDVSVTLGGSLANANIADYSAVGVQYIAFSAGTVNDINWSNATKTAATTKATPWTVNVTGLTAQTQYAYRAYATPATGTELYGEAKTLITSGGGGGEGTTVTVDFSRGVNMATPALPTRPTTGVNTDGTYVIDGKTFIVHAATNFYWWENTYQPEAGNPASLFIGKAGSYVQLPVVAGKALTSVTVYQPIGGGAGIAISVKSASEAVVDGGSATINPGETVGMTLTGTSAATAYRLYVDAAKNLHIGKLVLNYGGGGGTEPQTPEITVVNPASLTWAAAETSAKTIAVSGTNLSGVTLSATSSVGAASAFTFAVSGTTVTVTPKAANTGSADVTETLTIAAPGGNSKTVALTQSKPAGGAATEIVLDFATGVTAEPAFPTSKQSTPPDLATHTIGGYAWKFLAKEAYYVMAGNKLLIGKQDSYVEMPAVAGKKLTSVVLTTPAGSSGKVTVGVLDASGTVVAGGESKTLAASQTFTYTLTGTAAATSYRLTVTNANNFQIETLTLTYK